MNELPTLSNIVDALTKRIEGIQDTGDPHELAVLRKARNDITDFAIRDSRNRLMIHEIQERLKREESA